MVTNDRRLDLTFGALSDPIRRAILARLVRGGATEVVVGHELFPSVEAKAGHEEGWESCLKRLEAPFS